MPILQMRNRTGLHWLLLAQPRISQPPPPPISKSLICPLLRAPFFWLQFAVPSTLTSRPIVVILQISFLQLWAGELPLISLECYEVRWPLFRSARSVSSEVCGIEHLTGKYCMESNSSSTCSPLPAKPPHICRASPKDLLDFYLLGNEELTAPVGMFILNSTLRARTEPTHEEC